jgi:hypothetical protein
MDSDDEKLDGYIHTHTNGLVPMFSADDVAVVNVLYNQGRINDLSKFTMILIDNSDGSAYSVCINDPAAFRNFCNNNLDTQAKRDQINNSLAVWGLWFNLPYQVFFDKFQWGGSNTL